MNESNKQPDHNDTDDMVITPGGPRPKDKVHPVGPGEAIRRNEDGSYTVVRQTPPPSGEKEGCDA